MIEPALVILGFLVGGLVGLSGIGLGTIGASSLLFVFGINPKVVVASNMLFGTLMKSIAALRHASYKNLEKAVIIPALMGGIPGVLIGTQLLGALPEWILRRSLGAILMTAALAFFLKKKGESHPHELSTMNRRTRISIMASSLSIGLVIGLSSMGSGTFFILMFVGGLGLEPQKAVGTNLVIATLLSIPATLAFLHMGLVDIPLAMNLTLGSLPGLLIGSHFCVRSKQENMHLALSSMIALSGMKLMLF
ncbi:MAG: sulfite exporter TauE/SafE family protein [Candidatus Undinarchaeales archaeon]|jgi:hypothetical protein|nr:sulfite exporter TauE/SafE family protein [Candidatus Undinarchaeales archaeon]MDP7493889.1 sulfite exporter TauE/SafE family protein [Candidatus Undinarchaeales archaeon]